TPQLLVYTEDERNWMLSPSFEVLGVLLSGNYFEGTTLLPKSLDCPFPLILSTNQGIETYFLRPHRTEFVTIFFRHPWLAALAAFVPMALIAGLIGFYSLRIRQKNRTIRQTNEELAGALDQLRDAQDRLVAAEKFKQARDIAGGFAHEIRNALFPARGALMKIKTSGQPIVAGSRYEQMIGRAVARAIDITRLISAYTRLEYNFEPEAVNLAGIINDVVMDYRPELEEQQIALVVDGNQCREVTSNREQLRIVITNLLRNSIDALAGRGHPRILVSWLVENNHTVLRVADNGCGIPDTVRTQVFDAFVSTKPDRGTGLGLTMSRKIVEMYGGTLTIETTNETGTTMCATFEGTST
ncbi:MAG: HAMP domain-containing histidine kinase, partial [candidate division Zixibacteria bacterium]|nr:HAMP domain-containing histidine kinase [candidate division Zixibacteria bacterium]